MHERELDWWRASYWLTVLGHDGIDIKNDNGDVTYGQCIRDKLANARRTCIVDHAMSIDLNKTLIVNAIITYLQWSKRSVHPIQVEGFQTEDFLGSSIIASTTWRTLS